MKTKILFAALFSLTGCLGAEAVEPLAQKTENMSGMQMNMKGIDQTMPGMDMRMPGMNMNAKTPDIDMSLPTMDLSMPGGTADWSSQSKRTAPLMPQGHLEVNDVAEPGSHAKSYSLEDLEKLALQHNPTLVEAKAQLKGERGKSLYKAGIWPNPFMGYVGDLMGVPGAPLGEFQGANFGQEVILGGKLKYSRKKYEARQVRRNNS